MVILDKEKVLRRINILEATCERLGRLIGGGKRDRTAGL